MVRVLCVAGHTLRIVHGGAANLRYCTDTIPKVSSGNSTLHDNSFFFLNS